MSTFFMWIYIVSAIVSAMTMLGKIDYIEAAVENRYKEKNGGKKGTRAATVIGAMIGILFTSLMPVLNTIQAVTAVFGMQPKNPYK